VAAEHSRCRGLGQLCHVFIPSLHDGLRPGDVGRPPDTPPASSTGFDNRRTAPDGSGRNPSRRRGPTEPRRSRGLQGGGPSLYVVENQTSRV
jgi:hypothetical protein